MANQNDITLAKTITRREAGSLAIMGAIAAVTGSTVNATAASATDPILAAIEAHKAAHVAFSEAVAISGAMLADHPDFVRAEGVTNATGDAAMQVAVDMTAIIPTTMPGVIALLEYIDAFNRGKIAGITTEHHLWPSELMDDDVTHANGWEIAMPWPFWILRNVQAALQSITAEAVEKS